MPAALDELEMQGGIGARDVAHFIEHRGGKKRIVTCTEEKRWDANSCEVVQGARAGVIVVGVAKAVDGRRDHIIEVVECAGARHRLGADGAGKAHTLAERFPSERAEEMRLVEAREAAIEMTRAAPEIEGHRHRRRAAQLLRSIFTLLAEPFEKDIAAKGDPGEQERTHRIVRDETAHHGVEVGGLARVVEAQRAIGLVSAGAKDEQIGGPSTALGLMQEPARIVRANGALETVQNEQARCAGRGIEAMEIEKIIVIGVPTLAACGEGRSRTHEFSPERAQVRSGNPPCGPIDAGGHDQSYERIAHNAWECGVASVYFSMDVQIFGVKKNPETRKALRFFAERRVKTHFVDLAERAASLGELRRFAQKFGVSALIDESSKRFVDRGLRNSRMSDDRWLELLADEPLMLKMPLVRQQNRLSVGLAETEWSGWVSTA